MYWLGGVPSEMDQAWTAPVVRPILLFEGEFAGGTVRYWTGYGDLLYDGHVWTGSGAVVGVSEIEETIDLKATGVAFTMSGVDVEAGDLALTTMPESQGRPARCYLAAIRYETADTLVWNDGTPIWWDDSQPIKWTDASDGGVFRVIGRELLFEGRMDVMDLVEDGPRATVTLTCEHPLSALEAVREHYWTSARQQVDYPADKGFDMAPTVRGQNLRLE